MTKPVEVITSVQRRRRWSRAEKERIVAAALAPDAVASEVAREAGIHASQLFRWRQELCGRWSASPPTPSFNSVVVAAEPVVSPAAPATTATVEQGAPGLIEIEFADGARMRLTGSVDAAAVKALVAVLGQSKRRRR